MGRYGKDDFETRTFPGRALHQDVATPAPHEVDGKEQTQPGPTLARAEEGFENALAGFGRDAASIVGDAQVNGVVRFHLHPDAAAGLARLNGVEQQVDQSLLEFRFVGPDMQPRSDWADLDPDRV